jgi:hypothetical protein
LQGLDGGVDTFVSFVGIERMPKFPGQALNFECPSAHLSFKIDCLSWKYRYPLNPAKASIIWAEIF